MNRNIKKGLEPLVIKVIATVICAFYILSPLHKEIGVFLHEITHQFDMPENILSHSNTIDVMNGETHFEHTLIASVDVHNHNMLDLLDNIFEAADTEKKSEDSNILLIKIDKHTRYQLKYIKPWCFVSYQKNKITLFVTEQTRLGYLKTPFLPPELF